MWAGLSDQQAGSGGCHLHHKSLTRTLGETPLTCPLALWHCVLGKGGTIGAIWLSSHVPSTTKKQPCCFFCIAEKYNPVFVNEDKYITWRTGPYNSATWNKHSTYLPLLPKVESKLPALPLPPNWSCPRCHQHVGLCSKMVAILQELSSLLAGDKDGDLPAQHTCAIPPKTCLPQSNW